MKILQTPLSGLLLLQPRLFHDDRGYFFETFQQKRYGELGLPTFVQDNVTRSKQGVLRGLHYQLPHAQGKLVGVARGIVWDVVVDLRRTSPTFGQWFNQILSDENHLQMYIPPGFAHGYCVLSDQADFYYKCSDFYSPADEHGIIWNDATLHIPWPITHPILSPKDEIYPSFNEISHEKFFA